MAMKLFPQEIEKYNLSMDIVKAKLNYFELQIHELHWQTRSVAEHEALGDLYTAVFNIKDEIVEKLMGYTGVRTKAMPVDSVKNYTPEYTRQVVKELADFAYQLQVFGDEHHYCDIENLAQGLSGDAAKVLYRLTLS